MLNPLTSIEPYSLDDEVRIYLEPTDPDAHTHGRVYEIIDILADDLDIQTDCSMDAYSYMLRELETGEALPLAFHHQDLVPIDGTH